MLLLLGTNRKSHMGSPTAPLNLTLSDLERSNSRSPKFGSLITRKGAYLGHMLLLNINRNPKPYTGNPMTPLHLTLSDLERSKSRSLRFRSLISRKGAQ